jgi:SAM-dependent methyltransferase
MIHGLRVALRRAFEFARRARRRLALALRTEAAWVKKKRRVDREFDEAFGVHTGGITQLKRLNVVGNRADGVPHIASDPEEFQNALDALDVDFSQFTFVDLGAGKGRALLLAAGCGFKKIIGVEFARELVEEAERNIRAARYPKSATITILQQDATTYDLPDEATIVFMYNPFGGATMEAVARRTRASVEKHSRPVHVVYLNPFHLGGWIDAGFSVDRREHFAILRLPGAVAAARSQAGAGG